MPRPQAQDVMQYPAGGRAIGLPSRVAAERFHNHMLGANTVSRWESGRNVQTAAMDMLLRLIRDLPGSIDYLRDHAA